MTLHGGDFIYYLFQSFGRVHVALAGLELEGILLLCLLGAGVTGYLHSQELTFESVNIQAPQSGP